MIKLFEEYNSYYKEIDEDEYLQIYKYIPFTEKELSILKNLFKIAFRYYDKKVSYIDEKDYLKVKEGCSECCVIYFGSLSSFSGSILISKLDDEWFMLTIHVLWSKGLTYYKCDQFEGLLKCIEDVC